MMFDSVRQLTVDARFLLTSPWDMNLAEQVCERAEELAEPMNDARLSSLAEAALGFAAYLSAFTDSRVGPVENRKSLAVIQIQDWKTPSSMVSDSSLRNLCSRWYEIYEGKSVHAQNH